MKPRLLLFILFTFSFTNAQTISTRAGSTSGYVEGTSATARFNGPYGIAIDGGSAVVVTDRDNNRVRKVYSDNSTGFWAGSATSGTIINGTGAAARFNNLTGVARDGFNNAYVCDTGNHAIRKITSSGVVTTFAGGTIGTADGTGTAAQFQNPQGLAIDASGNLYVSDTNNHRIRKITSAGVVTTLAGSTDGFVNGTGAGAQFSYPFGIAVDASGNVFVGENCRIRKITPAGVVTTFAGGTVGYLDGNGTAARFNIGILGITIGSSGDLYVADSYNYRIRKITAAGVVTTYAGLGYSGTTDGDVSVATFNVITGITIENTTKILYIVDHFNNRIRAIAPSLKPDILSPTVTPNLNSAMVNYSLNAKNFATTSVVKYGLSSSNLTNQVTGLSASGTSNVNGNIALPTLNPCTTYYYQIEATNSVGTSYSEIYSFTTLSSGPAITFTNSPTTYNSTTINYSLNTNGSATTSLIRYGLTSGNLSSQVTGSSSSGTTAIAAFANLSGLTANTTYYFQIEATNSSCITTSSILSFTTDSQVPGIYSVTASPITTNSASINYSVWDKELSTTTLVRYGLSSVSLTNQAVGFSVSGNTTVAGNASLTGLTPNTTYYYQVEATNSAGTTTSTVASFTTLALPSQIANYTFNNSLNNAAGNSPFAAANTTFVANRNSVASSAIRVGSTSVPATATITNLPIGNAERTISFWHKKPAHSTAIGLFAYGTGAAGKTFGLYLAANGNYVFQSSVNDVTFTNSSTGGGVWVHSVLTFKNGFVKLYNNGSFVNGSTNVNLNTENSTFRLGGNGAIVEFDDLQIYNYELNVTQVGELYNNNFLSSPDFSQNNLKVSLYPNPVNDILNIESDTEIKSVEIYNLQGQKIKTALSKQVNVSDLSSGIYMVRIEDENNAVETKKIVKQ